ATPSRVLGSDARFAFAHAIAASRAEPAGRVAAVTSTAPTAKRGNDNLRVLRNAVMRPPGEVVRLLRLKDPANQGFERRNRRAAPNDKTVNHQARPTRQPNPSRESDIGVDISRMVPI